MKIEAALGVATILKQEGRDLLAVQVLQSAKACARNGQELNQAWLDGLVHPNG